MFKCVIWMCIALVHFGNGNSNGYVRNGTNSLMPPDQHPASSYIKIGFPKNVTVWLNETAEFECPTVTNLAVEIVWLKSSVQNYNDTSAPVNLPHLKPVSTNHEILRLHHVTVEDEGWYTCYVSNNLGVSAASAYLAVISHTELPVVPYFVKPTTMSKLIVKPIGNFLRLQCIVNGYPEPSITWSKDGDDINRQIGGVKYRKFAIIMEESIQSDSGNYTCRACNEHGCIEHSTQVIVVERVSHRPILTEIPQNLTLTVDEQGEMKCTFLSDLHSVLTWIKYNDTIKQADKQVESVSDGVLRFKNVTFADEGWYTCYVRNSLETLSSSAYLTVIAEPLVALPGSSNELPIWILKLIFSVASTSIIVIGVMYLILKKSQIRKHNNNLNLEVVSMLTKPKGSTVEV